MTTLTQLAFLGLPGHMELWIILLVVLILFGAKLPQVARNIGRSFTEFKKGVKGEGEDEEERPAVGRDEAEEKLEDRKSGKPEERTTA